MSGQCIVFRVRTAERVAAELFVRAGGYVPPHVHAHQWERFEGVGGELRFRLGRERRTLGAGDTLVVPPGTPHGLRNVGRGVAHFLIELSPPRRGEEGLRALFGLQRDGRVRVTRFAARPLLQVAVLFDEYLDEVHLPVVPFELQRHAFRGLARIGRRRGYRSSFPEYAARAVQPRAMPRLWYVNGMARTRISTTVDADLLAGARRARSGVADSALMDEALAALLARQRTAEIDDGYAAYDVHPLDARDEWGDLASFRAAAGTS